MNNSPNPEAFISPAEAAEFLRCSSRYVLRLARSGQLPAHPLRRGARQQWRFLKSELYKHLTSLTSSNNVPNGSLSRSRRKQ